MPTQTVWKSYRKKTIQPMRPYIPGEDLSGISVNSEDTPEKGGMVAYNPGNSKDQWYIGKDFVRKNYEPAYPENGNMNFGQAIQAAKEGKKIARTGWNGKNMFVVLMPELKLPPFNSQETGAKVNDRTAKHIGPDTPLDSRPYFAMFTAQGEWQPGWLASQADMLAEDWAVVG